jgi:hypothetical protein
MDEVGKAIAGVVAAVIAVAVLAVILSNSSNTSNVLTSFFGGVQSLLGTALGPITGGSSGTAASNLLNLNQGNTAMPSAFGSTYY